MHLTRCLVPLMTLWFTTETAAQRIDTTSAKAFKLDFAVPDAPAFTLLKVDQNQILRPTSVRELGLAVSDFVGKEGRITVPQAFAVEFAPLLLLDGPRLTVSQYQKRDWLYRLRLSAATQRVRDGTRPTQVAFGLRAAIVDRADLRDNDSTQAWRHFLTRMTTQLVLTKQDVDDTLAALLGSDWISDHPLAADNLLAQPDPEAREAAARRLGVPERVLGPLMAFFTNQPRTVAEIRERIEQKREELQDLFWNALSVQVAFAVSAAGHDSTGLDLKMTKYSGWITVALPIGRKGQWLLGAQEGMERDTLTSRFRFGTALSSRIYLGTNAVKFFTEGQVQFREGSSPRWMLNAGGEVTPPFGGWATFGAGLEYDRNTRTTGLVTNFAYKFGLPKLFN